MEDLLKILLSRYFCFKISANTEEKRRDRVYFFFNFLSFIRKHPADLNKKEQKKY